MPKNTFTLTIPAELGSRVWATFDAEMRVMLRAAADESCSEESQRRLLAIVENFRAIRDQIHTQD